MNPVLKKIIFVICFILATLVLPAFVLLLFVDASQNFSIYVVAFGVIIFAILGYIVSCVRDMEKKIESTMDEIKMQNAAIAYKLSSNMSEFNPPAPQPEQAKVEENVQDTVVNTVNVPLNPADPLVIPTVKKAVKVADDGFDDFK